MSKNPFRSIGTVFAGLVAVVVLSLLTDFVVETTGVLPSRPLHDWRQGLIELAYRSIYVVLGSYIAARLAPNGPMEHALALGAVGFVLSILSAVATWNMNLAPAWFTLGLIALVLPCTWLGGKLGGSLGAKIS
jgi:hypothetical protein